MAREARITPKVAAAKTTAKAKAPSAKAAKPKSPKAGKIKGHVKVIAREARHDITFRSMLIAVPGSVYDILFALANAATALMSRSLWAATLGAYYLVLSVARVGTIGASRKIHNAASHKEAKREEHRLRKRTGILLLAMGATLGGFTAVLLLFGGGNIFSGIALYIAGLYGLWRLGLNLDGLVRYRDTGSVALATLQQINIVDSLVSILTIATALFAAFGGAHELNPTVNALLGSLTCATSVGLGVWNLRHVNGRAEARVR